MNLPDAPTNVRFIDHDDVVHAAEIYYGGLDDNGIHMWVATVTWQGLPKGMLVDHWPCGTGITLEYEP